MPQAVHRVEVRFRPGRADPEAGALLRRARALGVGASNIASARVYLLEGDLSAADVDRIRDRLLADPVTEESLVGAAPAAAGASVVEVHPLPGVMDPAAQSVRDAVRDLVSTSARVSTGRRFDISGVTADQARSLVERTVANPVIHAVHAEPFAPASLPRGRPAPFELRRVAVRGLDDAALARLSRDAHLFLSVGEMRAIRDEFGRLGRDPTDAELETLAQTWSEHCVHKTLKSRVVYHGPAGDVVARPGRPGVTPRPDGSVEIDNLLKSTVAAATRDLIASGVDWALSVFEDNSGVIAFDDRVAVCVKVETHNHPSAIEPYGGAATGIGGCIRDIIGTGLGARPIASTDVFCVARPEGRGGVPAGCLPPRRVLTDVVAGVRDYGNRMGIPTVAGAVSFDDRYVGNPLVFCGCIGALPRGLVRGRVAEGDLIVALGGRTGRDGIHGATFSSAELTDEHAGEFGHAVQIGNAIEEKRLLDAIMRARDHAGGPLYHAITDCGAGGFSSAVGEMGSALGAEVDLDRAPLKYDGLTYAEIWISEAQERMVLAVPEARLAELRAVCDEEGVETAVLGRFGTPGRELILRFHGSEVGRLPMGFLHEGLPRVTRAAAWPGRGEPAAPPAPAGRTDLAALLPALLAHPDIASKHWIIRQYDHEVQGNSVVKPLVGPAGRGPGDGSVIEPVPGAGRGLAVACGLQTPAGDPERGGDPYLMALAAIDECVRNLVCLGADPRRIAILDNFCWPGCAEDQQMGLLVRACVGCYDGAMAYRTPFISGKDSLNNQFTTADGRTIRIPPTLLITGVGIVPRLDRCTTSDAKRPGNLVVIVGATGPGLGASRASELSPGLDDRVIPAVDLAAGPRNAAAVARVIAEGLARSAHDCSEGGLMVAVAEMLIGGSSAADPIGAEIDLDALPVSGGSGPGVPSVSDLARCYGETPGRYVLEVDADRGAEVSALLADTPHAVIGRLDGSGRLRAPGAGIDAAVEDLSAAWRGPLDW